MRLLPPTCAVLPLLLAVATAQAHTTPFVPAEHGFVFANTFQNDALPALDLKTHGLCGGMSYAALDFFLARQPIPRQDYRPANGTPLQRYVYARQVKSLIDNAGRWLELYADVRGARRAEFFARGFTLGEGGELAALRACLDQGRPVPLGLKAERGMSHQVLAIGYDLGRHQADGDGHQDEVRVVLCDPNFPGRTRTMVPDLAAQAWVYAEGPKRVRWTSWFVDVHYAAKTPPPALQVAPWPDDGLVHELVLECSTGDNDLRGGDENLDVVVHAAAGAPQVCPNVNLGARWLARYREHGRIVLDPPVAAAALQRLELAVPAGDGFDLQQLRVRGLGRGIDVWLAAPTAHSFTAKAPRLTVALAVQAKAK